MTEVVKCLFFAPYQFSLRWKSQSFNGMSEKDLFPFDGRAESTFNTVIKKRRCKTKIKIQTADLITLTLTNIDISINGPISEHTSHFQ